MGTKTKKKKSKKSVSGKSPAILGKYDVVSVKRLKRNPWNYNEMDEVGMEKLKATMRLDGFIDDIIVREIDDPGDKVDYEIIDGEHRWFAAKELGMAKVPIKNLGKIDDIKAKALTIKLNELKGRPDTERMALIVDEIIRSTDDDLINTMPFDDEEMSELSRLARETVDDVPDPKPGTTNDDEDGDKRTRKVNDKFDLHTVLGLGHISDDEEEEFVQLLRQIENVMGIEKRPFRLIMRLMRERIKAISTGDRKARRKKKKKE